MDPLQLGRGRICASVLTALILVPLPILAVLVFYVEWASMPLFALGALVVFLMQDHPRWSSWKIGMATTACTLLAIGVWYLFNRDNDVAAMGPLQANFWVLVFSYGVVWLWTVIVLPLASVARTVTTRVFGICLSRCAR